MKPAINRENAPDSLYGNSIDEDAIQDRINSASQPVVIDIWMDDCPPCNMLAPKLKAVAQNYEGQIKVLKVNVENDSPVFDEYDIEMVPTLLFFKTGEEIGRLEGLVHSNELDQEFKKAIED